MYKKIFTLVLLLSLFGLQITVSAHEERTVGIYAIELGWRVEPAYVGVYNGPELFVSDADGNGVVGLESALSLMAHFGGEQKMLALFPVYSDPGHYTADLIPTRPGDYGFHLFGQINGTQVDEAFTSADGLFGTVEPITDIQFPALDDTEPTSSLQAQLDALRAELDALKTSQSS
jgi:hypothetical protein